MNTSREYCLLRMYERPIEQGLNYEDYQQVNELINQGYIIYNTTFGEYELSETGRERLSLLRSIK